MDDFFFIEHPIRFPLGYSILDALPYRFLLSLVYNLIYINNFPMESSTAIPDDIIDGKSNGASSSIPNSNQLDRANINLLSLYKNHGSCVFSNPLSSLGQKEKSAENATFEYFFFPFFVKRSPPSQRRKI